MKYKLYKKLFSSLLLIFMAVPSSALNASGGHRGGITALIHKGDTVISAGEDGFIVIWNISERAASWRFQLTTGKIQSMVSHPQRDELCIIESDGMDNYRISAWNYTLKEKLFSLHSYEPVTYINYSAGGSFIIAAGFSGSYLTLFDSETGEIINTPDVPPVSVTLSVTGTAERNMLIYQTEQEDYSFFEPSERLYGGRILYLNLDSDSVTGSFRAPADLLRPIIFGNNRFIAGINHDGLLLIDAASGEIFDSIETIERNALICPSDDGFYCLTRRNGSSTLYRFSVDRNGKLVIRQQLTLSFNADSTGAIAYNGSVVFASTDGDLFMLDQQNKIAAMTHNFQARITEITAGETTIAFLTENSELYFLPLDYSLLGNTDLTPVNKQGYTRITRVSSGGEDQFLLWQSANARQAPLLVSADNKTDGETKAFLLGRFPIRSISYRDNRLLILDSAGSITVHDMGNTSGNSISERAGFSFSSAGTVDAAFIDNDYFILCRSAINNNSPFLFVNYRTGETVPVFYPVQAVLTVYAGNSGNVYAEAIERDNGIKTTVLRLPAATGARAGASRIFEYRGETANLSIAELPGRLAIACGSDGAVLFADETKQFERTNGLPEKLLACGQLFLSLDSEGNIAWHDNSGKILAVFRLYEDRWTLSHAEENTGKITRH
jgi:WD40 repeat protein